MVAETSQVVNFSGKVQSTGPNVPFIIAVNNANKIQASEKPPIMFHDKTGKHMICAEFEIQINLLFFSFKIMVFL